MKKIYTLPYKFKFIGIFIFTIGVVLSFFRFSQGIKPEFLKLKVFAIYSSFLEKNYFKLTTNNIFEEICGLTVLLGLLLIIFSKEKDEMQDIQEMRLISFFQAMYLNFLIMGLAFLFIYGLGFIYYMVINLYLQLILYIIIFHLRLFKNRFIQSKIAEG